MPYPSENAFVDEFLACLKNGGKEKIPFANDKFTAGIDKMAEYFRTNRKNLGDVASELSLLFIKNPLQKTYRLFQSSLVAKGDIFVAFPEHEDACVLTMFDEDTATIFKNNRSGVDPEFVQACTATFCEGAGIACSKKMAEK